MTNRKLFQQDYFKYCLRGDLNSALKAIELVKQSRDNSTWSFYQKVVRRFIRKSESLAPRCRDPFVKVLILYYRNYYRSALLNPNKASNLEKKLRLDLENIAREFGLKVKHKTTWLDLETSLQSELLNRGFFSLWGTVKPFRSLLIWKSQKFRTFKTILPITTQTIQVNLLDEFIELGWLHLATFGKYYVGGWAGKDELFCVIKAYKNDLTSEKFRVSFLVHEAQHFSDYKLYPKLTSFQLEYRAKLAELFASKRPQRLLLKFQTESNQNKKFPHSHASWRLIQDFKNVESKNLSHWAKKLLEQDTERLNLAR